MFGGRSFDGPMQGHNLVQAWPSEVHLTPQPWHYDLHVWLWEENPDGIFAQYNRRVSCKDGLEPEGTSGSGAGSPPVAIRKSTPVSLDRANQSSFYYCSATR
jgi:hypothetical protein